VSGAYLDLARAHAPVLMLVLLLGGAALSVAVSQARLSWAVALLASGGALFVSLLAGADRLLRSGAVPAGEAGVGLAIDGVGAIAAPLLSGLLVLTLLSAAPALRALHPRTAPYAIALALCVAAGWIGALFAEDLLGLIAGSQIGWLAAVALLGVCGDRERGALNGALRMWTYGGAGAALMVLGLGLVMRAIGGADVAAAASVQIGAPNMAAIGYVLVLLPLALFAGVAPLHGWAGAAFGRADGFVAMTMGGVGVIGAAAVLTRLSAYVAAAPAIAEGVDAALVALGGASVLIGAVQAVGAVNLGRLVAYAGATQAGCILLALALGSPAGFAAALIQLFAWAAGALALLIGAAAARSFDFGALDGLARRAPIASAAITAGALSLMGAPLTIGFLGRWRLIEASVGAGWWWATGAAIAASLAAVFYGGRLIERIYFRRVTEAQEADGDFWRFMRAPVAMAAIVAIGVGIAPSFLIQVASRAAALVLGHGV
jgi:multicomponent Na+:H+ antiporter subunit D